MPFCDKNNTSSVIIQLFANFEYYCVRIIRFTNWKYYFGDKKRYHQSTFFKFAYIFIGHQNNA